MINDRSGEGRRTEARAADPRQRRREQKVARIIEEAWDLARRDGLAGISLRDLADRVDLRQPSLYAYFESKLDIYDAMFADGNRQLLDHMRQREPAADPSEELVQVVESLVRFSGADVVRHQLLFQRTIPGFEPSPASYAAAIEFYEFARQRLQGAGVSDPGDMDIFTALVAGLAHQQVANDPGGDRWVRQARPVVEMLLSHIHRRHQPRSRTTEPS